MRLSTHTDYALRVLVYLASTGVPTTTVASVAEAYAISRNHLVKVVHRLGTLGFVRTARGRGGGFGLARRPEAITVGEVVRGFEDHRSLVECLAEPGGRRCRIAPACGLAGAVVDATNAFLAVLDGYTLSDITERRSALVALLDVGSGHAP